jgi:DNA-binding NarL/FixJ family response regulator
MPVGGLTMTRRSVTRLSWAGKQLLVVNVGAGERGFEALTESEREIVRAAGAGLSNAEIARQRRRSERTVANQLASAFRKLGVASRHALAARLTSR